MDKFLSISGYKRRQMSSSSISKLASLRSPRGTSPPTPPPPPPAADTNRPPPRVPRYPPPRTSALRTSSGHPRQSHPQQPHSNQFSHKEPYYDRQRQQYSRSVGCYRADHRPYISPSDDPLAAFQVTLDLSDSSSLLLCSRQPWQRWTTRRRGVGQGPITLPRAPTGNTGVEKCIMEKIFIHDPSVQQKTTQARAP